MAQQTVSLFDKALKDIYFGPIRDQLNRSSVLHDQFRKDSESILGGRRARIPVLVSGNTGVGSISETGTLPTAGFQTVEEAIIPLKFHYGRIQITDPVMEASKTDRMAFKNAFTLEADGMMKDMKDLIGRQIFNDGTPTIADVATTENNTNVDYDNARHRNPFKNGQIIDLISADETTETVGDRTISAVTPTSQTAGSFTISGAAVAKTDGERITLANAMVAAATPTYHEFTGVNGAVGNNSGNFGQIIYLSLDSQASESPIWQSQIIDGSTINGSDPIDEHFQTGADLVERDSGEYPDCIVTTYGVRSQYANTLEQDKRFMDLTLTGGWSAIGFQGGNGTTPIFVDKHCTTRTAYGLTKAYWAIYRLADFGWLDKDGAVLSRIADSPSYEATMRYYAELGCSKRNAQYRIHTLNEV